MRRRGSGRASPAHPPRRARGSRHTSRRRASGRSPGRRSRRPCRPCRSRPRTARRRRAEFREARGALGGRLVPRRADLRDGVVACREDREHSIEAGDLEDLRDVAVAADERELAVARAEPLHAAHEHAERRRIDERRVAEVDDDLLGALADHLEKLLLELRSGVEIDLARERDDAYVISLAGEVDLYTAPEFKQQLLEVIGQGAKEVVVDFSNTTFIDSTTLGVLVGGVKRLRSSDGQLSLVCSDRNITKIFEITGLDRVFTIFPTRDDAVATLGTTGNQPPA